MIKINFRHLAAVVCAAALLAVICLSFVSEQTSDIEDSVLRLHIVANSNSEEDQALKLKVRDEIIERCGFLFLNCRTREESERTAQNNLGFFTYVAKETLRENGCEYPVSCTVERCAFPTKRYGLKSGTTVSLPSGDYSALNIKIGGADGANWWCVMYPPLCFVDGVVGAEGEERLKDSLSDSEYELITGDTPGVRIKFKIAELIR